MDHGEEELRNRCSKGRNISVPLADQAPTENAFTPYDEAHFAIYLALLNATGEGVGEPEICRSILGINPAIDSDRATLILRSHLVRAKWLAGSAVILREPCPAQNT
jgi:hypothetical protein